MASGDPQATAPPPAGPEHDYAEARGRADVLLADGRIEEAEAELGRALAARPGDHATLVDLGHAAYARGRVDEALERLGEAAAQEPGALRDLLEIQRRLGRGEAALSTARALAAARPDDVAAVLDLAELSLAAGQLDDAARAYGRLRALDAEPGHEIYAWHALIAVEVRRGAWRRVLDLALEASRVDRERRTTELIAFAAARVFGDADRPACSREEVDRLLRASLAEHRALHAEPLAV
jgi:tetratricopeptide (TPR) repeat protein